MTYEESSQLMQDMQFRGRVKVACLKFADSILNEPTGTAGHNTRLRWATNCQQQPDLVASQVQPPTVMDAAVQAAGAGISDDALQASVEAVVNKML
jgi:hypothetical protein